MWQTRSLEIEALVYDHEFYCSNSSLLVSTLGASYDQINSRACPNFVGVGFEKEKSWHKTPSLMQKFFSKVSQREP